MEIITTIYSFLSAIFVGAIVAGQKKIAAAVRTSQENQESLRRVESDVKEILRVLNIPRPECKCHECPRDDYEGIHDAYTPDAE